MAQTPYRDIISSAVIDIRPYTGSYRNFANNANALSFSNPDDPIFKKVNGIDALVMSNGSADQTWMASGVTELTIEMLVSMDFLHFPGSDDHSTFAAITGDWSLGFATEYNTGDSEHYAVLWGGLKGETYAGYGGGENIRQELGWAPSFKGAPVHVIFSAVYTPGEEPDPINTVTLSSYVNGSYSTYTGQNDDAITAAPTNVLFGGYGGASEHACPVYLFRMWNTRIDDELVFSDMYQAAKKILPGQLFPTINGGSLGYNGLS